MPTEVMLRQFKITKQRAFLITFRVRLKQKQKNTSEREATQDK